MTEQRGGTGTGVWTHPAAETMREDGTVAVGLSVEKLLAALYREMNRHRSEIMPEHIAATVLRSYGLATTYAEAAELWKRMEEAAKSDGNN